LPRAYAHAADDAAEAYARGVIVGVVEHDTTSPAPEVPASETEMTYGLFMSLFPDDDACLDFLKARFHRDGSACEKCGRDTKFHRIKGRAAYSCQYCGHQVYPTARTIFHKSTVSLQLWFWAIHLVSSTRGQISAKQLERELGVSYPTAHRMLKQIRALLAVDGAFR
jgi:transposase